MPEGHLLASLGPDGAKLPPEEDGASFDFVERLGEKHVTRPPADEFDEPGGPGTRDELEAEEGREAGPPYGSDDAPPGLPVLRSLASYASYEVGTLSRPKKRKPSANQPTSYEVRGPNNCSPCVRRLFKVP